MMRALIFTLLALSVRAAHWGHGSYLGGVPSYSYSSYPSYSYGSGLYGSLYGSGLGYGWSGLHGSKLHYGTGLGHGYYGYGGVRTLHGGHAGHLTTAIRPSIYSSRYDIQNPSRAILKRGQIVSNAPGKMEFIMGDAGHKAKLGAISGQSPVMKYAPRVPYSSGAMLGGGFISHEGPAKIEFTLGDAGFKTGAVGLEGYSKPAIHKYAPMTPHGTGYMHSSGLLANDAPGKIEFLMGDSGYKTGAAAISGHAKPIVLKASTASRRIGQAPKYGMPITDPSGAHFAFNQDFSKVSGIGAPKLQNFNKATGFLPRPAIGAPRRSGLRAAGGLPHSSVHGQAGFSHVKPAINIFTGAAVAPKYTPRVPYSSGAVHGGGLIGSEAPGKIEFMLGGSGFSTGAAALEGHGHRKPAAFHHGSAIDVASHHSAGIDGASAIGGHENIFFGHDIADVSGLHSSGVIPAARPLTIGGAIKPATRNIHRANLIRKSGTHGYASGVAAGPQMTFDMGQAALRKPGMKIESFDKMISPAVATSHGSGIHGASLHSAGIGGISGIGGHENIHFTHGISGVPSLHSSGVIPSAHVLTAGGAIRPSTHNIHHGNLIHKSGAHGLTSGVAEPHVSFNMGEAAHRKPAMHVASLEKAIAPGIASRPFSPSGIRRVSANIPAYSSSGVAGPAGISFIQDFSKAIGSHTAGVHPFLSIDNKLSAPIIPSMAASPRSLAAHRNRAGFISSSIAKPLHGALAYRAPKHPGSHGGSIFAPGSAINTAEGHAMDFKHGITGLGGQMGGRLDSFEIAPESGIAHFDKSFLTHSTAGAAIPGGIVSGAHHSSTGIRSGSLHGSTESLNKMTGDKIFVDGAVGDKSTILFHSTGVSGTGSLLGDQGSTIELIPAGINSALHGQGMVLSHSGFPSFPSSSHSGFSHVAREHGRDKSIFYSAGSPNLVRSSTSDIIRK